MRRFIGTLLCLAYGFALPLFAVVAWTLWHEQRQEFDRVEALIRRLALDAGLPPNVEPAVLVPAAALVALIVIWILAGRRTRRATWIIVGLNAFAVAFVALVLIGPK